MRNPGTVWDYQYNDGAATNFPPSSGFDYPTVQGSNINHNYNFATLNKTYNGPDNFLFNAYNTSNGNLNSTMNAGQVSSFHRQTPVETVGSNPFHSGLVRAPSTFEDDGQGFQYNVYLDQTGSEALANPQDLSNQTATPYPPFENHLAENGHPCSSFQTPQEAAEFRKQAVHLFKHTKIPAEFAHNKTKLVRKFYNAMVSIDRVADNSFEVKNFRNGKYSKDEIEAACWRLVDLFYEVHANPASSTNPSIRSNRRDGSTKKDEDMSFEERVEALCEMLATRKTACGEVLNADKKLLNMVRAPGTHAARKEMNSRSNGYKAEKIKFADEHQESPSPRRASGKKWERGVGGTVAGGAFSALLKF